MDNVKFECNEQVIPTYVPYPEEQNPIFFENRNHQGASGRVFPLKLCTRMNAELRDRAYRALRLENEYIDVTLLPELGGRVYAAVDKTNGADFIYRNRKIKPQQIGLCGPWISGGIEFNWPQHHRPTTFQSVDWTAEHNDDGSTTVWMGEIEPFNRTKGMVGITVFPGRSYIKAKVRFFNRTPYPQTFMWWANLAVAVNEHWKAIFPDDIHWASGHAWATTSKFPILDGLYKGYIDYGKGTDVCAFPNVPTGDSFFTYGSKYDFLAGYDFQKEQGIVHVADRHICTGKKMFTWGVSDFSKAWFRNLSDDDGPYVELMTGIYTCNQPDFSWIMPYELKNAEQYWYPLRDIGTVRNATLDAAVGLDIEPERLRFAFNATQRREGCRCVLLYKDAVLYEKSFDIAPDRPFADSVPNRGYEPHCLTISLYDARGHRLVDYRPEAPCTVEVPAPLAPSPRPQQLDKAEEAYLHALHLYQYRHPYYDPRDYLDRALALDPDHIAANDLYGRILMQRGEFEQAEQRFLHAIGTATQRNPHPYDTQPYYDLGILQKLLGRDDEAYETLYRAVWGFAFKSAGYYALAELDCKRRRWEEALDKLQEALWANGGNLKARKLRAAVLRHLGRCGEALAELDAILAVDALDFPALYEKLLLTRQTGGAEGSILAQLRHAMRDIPEYHLDLALDYAAAGFYAEAAEILQAYLHSGHADYPILDYYLASFRDALGEPEKAAAQRAAAARKDPRGCLHARPESIPLLRSAVEAASEDAVAPYLLGNIYYGQQNFAAGIRCFELSVARKASFPTAYRNLAIGYFDKRQKVHEAGQLLRQAFEMNPGDARIFFELLQYERNAGVPATVRLEHLEAQRALVACSDDAYVKMVSTYTELGHYETAWKLLLARTYYPYEGGEGVVSTEFYNLTVLRAQKLLAEGKAAQALEVLEASRELPESFNTGKVAFVYPHAHLDYLSGLALEQLQEEGQAQGQYRCATEDLCSNPEMYYYAGLAWKRLGQPERAENCFRTLLRQADALLENKGRYPYFTKSLVTTLPFEHDTEKNDRATAFYYTGLAQEGLGESELAKTAFLQALALKPVHYMAQAHLNGLS